MRKTILGREMPDQLDGIELKPFAGAFAARPSGTRAAPPVKCRLPGDAKCLPDLDAVFTKVGLKSGMTLSFHHHFRNGDMLMNQVIAAAAKRGIKDLRIAASSIFPVHAPLVEFIRSGVITRIDSDYVSGPVAEAVSSDSSPELLFSVRTAAEPAPLNAATSRSTSPSLQRLRPTLTATSMASRARRPAAPWATPSRMRTMPIRSLPSRTICSLIRSRRSPFLRNASTGSLSSRRSAIPTALFPAQPR